jgi:hypothetical protein
VSPSSALGVVVAYFNPCGYRTRLQNFERFADAVVEAGAELAVIEAAFDPAVPPLPRRYGSQVVPGRDVMWQKERLLNVGIAALPAHVQQVAWLDGDVLFERPDWVPATLAALERHPIVQLFSEAVRLPRGDMSDRGVGDRYPGFAATYAARPQVLLEGDFARHGHTGFAWAARREVIAAHGLYDACIAGSGDHMMAHAFCGDWEGPCIGRILGPRGAHRRFFEDWSRRLYQDVRAQVGFVPGKLLHLWHGEIADRRYVLRNRELAAFGFDPSHDVRIGSDGCWEWASDKPSLHAWARAYFAARREDDEPAAGEARP